MSEAGGETGGRRLFTNGQALKIDVNRVTGGRSTKFHPQTSIEAAGLLRPQVDSAIAELNSLAEEFQSDNLYFEVRLLPNYLSASAFPERLANFLAVDLVGVKSDQTDYRTRTKPPKLAITKRLVFSGKFDVLTKLQALTSGVGLTSSGERAFEEDLRKLDLVRLAGGTDFVTGEQLEPDEVLTWEAVLHPQTDRGGRPVAVSGTGLAKWHQAVNLLDGIVYEEYERTVGGLTFSPVALTQPHAHRLLQFNGLRALRPVPKLRPRPGFRSRSAGSHVLAPGTLTPISSYPKVAVFDGGVDTFSRRTGLFGMPEHDITPEPADQADLAHGTAVVGAALYGLLSEGERAPRPALPLESHRVFPAPDVPGDLWGYWVLDRIVETVKREGYKIVNLSLGPEKTVEDSAEPDRWTSELDSLAHDSGVLFVVAAGNGGEFDQDFQFHRVQVPADMANGLSVGACDLPYPEKKWSRSAFSSMGPGRHGARIQPRGVQYGGTAESGLPMLRSDGSLVRTHGTSFAAPLMTNAISRLAVELPGFNVNTLRAFAVHFAERHRAFRAKVDEHGFGRFLLDYTATLDSAPDEAHVLFEDVAARSTLLGYQVPLPLTSAGNLELRVTLSYTSPTDAAQSTDYTAASVDLTFRPHSEMRTFTSPDDESVSVVLDRRDAEALSLISSGWKDSQEPPSRSLVSLDDRSEVKLREAGKWETLRHYRVKLRAGDALNPRLEVAYLARRSGKLEDDVPDLPFSMLVSISEPGSADFHDRVVEAFPTLVPVQRIGTQVRV